MSPRVIASASEAIQNPLSGETVWAASLLRSQRHGERVVGTAACWINPLESGTADSRLRELYRRTNSLPHLPEEIGSMAELRQIDLRGTPLAALPETLIELPRLEKLDLRWVTCV